MASGDRHERESRQAILAALRRHAPPAVPLPALDALGTSFADLAAQLALAVAAVGGSCVRVADQAGAAAVAALPHATGKKIFSLVPEVASSTFEISEIANPHELDDLDLAILPGRIAVAENGAVWVDSAALPHRAIFVIANHLVLVVHMRDVVANMHEAYARLAGRPRGHGVFISGPSKTADIEQVLVVGAQGPRTCTVVLIDD